MLRWTEEQLQEHLKRMRRAGVVVRDHKIHDEPNPNIPRGPRPKTKRGLPAGKNPPGKRGLPSARSMLEVEVARQLIAKDLPLPTREYKHIDGRDFRLDFAWPEVRIGLEVQGMPHRIKARFKADIEKRALGLLARWRILEVDRETIYDGRAIAWIAELMGRR